MLIRLPYSGTPQWDLQFQTQAVKKKVNKCLLKKKPKLLPLTNTSLSSQNHQRFTFVFMAEFSPDFTELRNADNKMAQNWMLCFFSLGEEKDVRLRKQTIFFCTYQSTDCFAYQVTYGPVIPLR